jgi:hypothetical protein
MFCPKCATPNLEGAKFCRSCGSNVSLIPQAMSGDLAPPPTEDTEADCWSGRRRGRRVVSIDSAFRNVFMGIGFMLVAVALAFSAVGRGWWFWMLIPAFSMMGSGLAQYMRLKERERRAYQPGSLMQPSLQAPLNSQMPPTAFPVRSTGELVPPPPSVTEGTTRHLGAEAATRHLDSDTRSEVSR